LSYASLARKTFFTRQSESLAFEMGNEKGQLQLINKFY